MKSIRIAAGAGYAGDRVEPALENIIYGNVDYIIFECLAERTIALAQKEKLHNPDKGYNVLLEYRMEKIIPLLKDHPVKIITNMGAANPVKAAEVIKEIAEKNKISLKVAAIIGDDIFECISDYYDETIIETGDKLSSIKDQIISANAYIGAKDVTEALLKGADIVVTGRIADPSLVTGPVMYEFGKDYSDNDFLGKTIVAGHLLECGGQVTGGYFADPGKKDVPDLDNLGFPILEFFEDGSMKLEKLPETGGLLNKDTVKEQLLYEIQDPANYYTPDVIADFTKIRLEEAEDEKIKILDATGHKKTGFLKVSVGYEDGFIGEGEISYGGTNATARAKLAGDVVKKRLSPLKLSAENLRIDIIGLNSLYKNSIKSESLPIEVRLRVAAHTMIEADAAMIGREVEALYTNGPAGGGGVRSSVREIISIYSILVPENVIKSSIKFIGGDKNETV